MERPHVRQKIHEKKVAQENLIKSIQKSSKNNMLPELKKKMEETSNLIDTNINNLNEDNNEPNFKR